MSDAAGNNKLLASNNHVKNSGIINSNSSRVGGPHQPIA